LQEINKLDRSLNLRMRRKILVLILLFSLVLAVVGCSQAGTIPDTQPGNSNVAGNAPVVENPKSSGTETPKPPNEEEPRIIKIGDMMSKPGTYWGQDVVLEGKIVNLCRANGCWFILDDSTGTIYVDLAPSGLTITAQKLGATAKVYGTVTKRGSDTYLIGKKVEF